MSEHKEEGVIKIKKDDIWKYSTFILLAFIVVGGFIYFNQDNDSPNGNGADNNLTQPQLPAQNARAQVSADDDPVLGKKDAPVTIIEFSDYQCPFCRKFWTETFSNIKKDYIDTGKVKFVYRDFPLGFHPAAVLSAEAAECAREVGKGDTAYFKMHDKIFQEGNKLDGGDPITGPVKGTAQYGAVELKKWAKDLGYDIGSCLDSGKYKSEVQKDQSDGAASGVQGTPAFFINGQLLSGAQPYSAFKQLIDAELAK